MDVLNLVINPSVSVAMVNKRLPFYPQFHFSGVMTLTTLHVAVLCGVIVGIMAQYSCHKYVLLHF